MNWKKVFISAVMILTLTGYLLGCEEDTPIAPEMGEGAMLRLVEAARKCVSTRGEHDMIRHRAMNELAAALAPFEATDDEG